MLSRETPSKMSSGGGTGSELPQSRSEVTDLIIDAGKTLFDRKRSDGRQRAAVRIGQRILEGDNGWLGGDPRTAYASGRRRRRRWSIWVWRSRGEGRTTRSSTGRWEFGPGSSVRRPVGRQGNRRVAERKRRLRNSGAGHRQRGSATRWLRSQNEGGSVEPGEGWRWTPQGRPSKATRW